MGPEILVFMLSLDCSVDFDSDSDFWAGFDAGMMDEWGITTATSCYQVGGFPSNIYGYKSLANAIVMNASTTAATTTTSSEVVQGRAATDFTLYIDSLLGQGAIDARGHQVVFLTGHSDLVFKKPAARGIAYVAEDMAFVENNFGYSTGTLSHEILHLVLEEEGHEKSCYVNKVHRNQFNYEMKEMGEGGKYPVVKKFEC